MRKFEKTHRTVRLLVALEVDNMTDELYYQHLSYLRNPLASGASVWEPGMTVTLGVRVTI
ncbi:MAG: hypothetical protein KAJ17_00780 [Candidatus Krumholzibacteria bacterium]|nr:hypothetical protein [Candidatus Krumholzibacteria bacterium]